MFFLMRVSEQLQVKDDQSSWWRIPLGIFALSRLVTLLGFYVGRVLFQPSVGVGIWENAAIIRPNLLLDIWVRFDSQFYVRIAENGYQHLSDIAFFPLYPLLIRALNIVTGDSIISGVLISHLAFFGALVVLFQLVTQWQGQKSAERTVLYLAFFPTTFFYSAIYTESLFLFLSVLVVYFARNQRWAWATIVAILLTGTRLIGILLYGIVLFEWWLVNRDKVREEWHSLLVIQFIPTGLIAFMLFNWQRFGDPLAFASAQSLWGKELQNPLAILLNDLQHVLQQAFTEGDAHLLIVGFNVVAVLVCLCLLPFIWRKLGAAYALYTFLSILIPLGSSTTSIGRYTCVIFPLFILLGIWGKSPLVDRAISLIFCAFMVLFAAYHVNWGFVG